MNPVATYCHRFAKSGKTPQDFARWMLVRERDLCLQVVEAIGSWPSSEPELAALQKVWR